MMMQHRVRWVVAGLLLVAVVALASTQIGYLLYPRGKAKLVDETIGDLPVKFWYPHFGRTNVDAAIEEFRDDLISGVMEDQASHGGAAAGHEHGDETDHEHGDGAVHEHEGEEGNLTVGYRVVNRTWRAVSVVFQVNIGSAAVRAAATQTGIDEVSYVVARTYDLWDDRVVSLQDITGQSEALDYLADYIRREVVDIEGVDRELVARGIGPTQEQLGNWVVDGSDIIVYLNPGQVAARSRGVIEVRVPIAALQ